MQNSVFYPLMRNLQIIPSTIFPNNYKMSQIASRKDLYNEEDLHTKEISHTKGSTTNVDSLKKRYFKKECSI